MRPRLVPTGSIADLRARRDAALYDLVDGRRHLLALLTDPDEIVAAIPTGDLLCRAPGLDDAAVARILFLAGIPWGRRIGLLSRRDVEATCFWIRDRFPDVWDGWRETVRVRARLAGVAPEPAQMTLEAAA